MNVPLVLVVAFAAIALGLSAFALYVSLGARRDARQALDGVRAVAARLGGGRRVRPEEPAQAPEEEPRRRHRAPETGDRYARLRASAAAREAHEPAPRPTPREALEAIERGDPLPPGHPMGHLDDEPTGGPSTPSGSSSANDATTEVPAVGREDLATVEHPAPSARYRRPPPPLPPPGAIGRPQ